MSPSAARGRGRQRGAALLAVLWFVAAVSALAVAFLRFSTGDRFMVVTQADGVRARALAWEGVARTVLVLNSRGVDRPMPRSLRWSLPEGSLVARIENEGAKIDLNAADSTLLGALARAAGVDKAKAERIGDAIIDWRDQDDLRQANGAERRDYDAGDRGYGPANQPFRQVEELRYVLPIDDAAYARMAPHLTIYSGKAEPERRAASVMVRTAMDMRGGLGGNRDRGRPGSADGPIAAEEGGLGTRETSAPGQAHPELDDEASLGSDAEGSAPAGPTATPQPDGATTAEGGTGAGRPFSIVVDVRLSEGYESHARAVVGLAGEGTGRILRVLDWKPALPAAVGG